MTLTANEVNSGGYVRDPDGRQVVVVSTGGSAGSAGVPEGATPITAASGNVGNAQAVATLAGTTGKTTYIQGFQVTASGATAGLAVSVTVAGLISGTATYAFTFPAGVAVGASPLIVEFPAPIPASATNTAIVVTLPAGGSGNTNAAVAAQGFQL